MNAPFIQMLVSFEDRQSETSYLLMKNAQKS